MFSIQDLTVERGDKLTLEKVISVGRSSEASKEQVKATGTKGQNSENPWHRQASSSDSQ